MTTDERIITAVTVSDGSYVDGTDFTRLMELTEATGLDIQEVYGDKAYFRKPILDKINEMNAKPYIPVSASVYRIDEEKFSYNKDSDEWFCSQGNKTVSKKHKVDKKGRQTYQYLFEKEQCRNCSNRLDCNTGSLIARRLILGVNTAEFYTYSQDQKTDEFQQKYKSRATHEGKNGEMKNNHGLDRARGYGKRSMSTQAKLTALAVNLKRIANILSFKSPISLRIIQFYFRVHRKVVFIR